MIGYTLRRLSLLVLVGVGVSTFLFVLAHLSGDPAALQAPPDATPEMLAATRERLGLNEPLVTQYLQSLLANFTLDFGDSFSFQQPAGTLVGQAIGPSLWIVLPGMVLGVLIAFTIGTVAALRPSRLSGRVLMVGAFIAGGIPYFWMALLLVLLFAVKLQVLPATGSAGLSSLVIPVAVLTVYTVSTTSRLVRGQLLDSFTEGYVLTARSKGLSARRVLFQHATPGALPPLLAWLGVQFSFVFSALLILEPLLGYNGLGALLIRSVTNQDFPLVQASVFCMAMLITLVNVGMDVIVRLIDPRLRAKAAA
ncbi:ABC transporter permease [Streptomyces sp. NBC_01754]|uniref:ABC transporter permease n=1 Tax=Streptomyces sp. NBC_01754 TaxID=2975930 RepID=UPI002DDA44DA|nr:ABC transporter permease [Streptomyces sp. NBC_01754]WSC91830.1 ABC transporter permease [Streptomyces sp. NBC_01754]